MDLAQACRTGVVELPEIAMITYSQLIERRATVTLHASVTVMPLPEPLPAACTTESCCHPFPASLLPICDLQDRAAGHVPNPAAWSAPLVTTSVSAPTRTNLFRVVRKLLSRALLLDARHECRYRIAGFFWNMRFFWHGTHLKSKVIMYRSATCEACQVLLLEISKSEGLYDITVIEQQRVTPA